MRETDEYEGVELFIRAVVLSALLVAGIVGAFCVLAMIAAAVYGVIYR